MASGVMQNEKQGLFKTIKDAVLSVVRTKTKYKIIGMTAIFLVTIYLSGFMHQGLLRLIGELDEYYFDPISMVYMAFSGAQFLITFLILAAITITVIRIYYLYSLHPKKDKNRNYLIAKTGTYGTDHMLTGDELEEAFNRSKNINTFKEDILGMDEQGYMCARRDKPFTNKNVAVVGMPGSGKSVCLAIPTIFQTIRRGESLIVTDSKGDLYAKTAAVARKAGYNIKILNLKPQELLFSDGVDLLKPAKKKSGTNAIQDGIVEDNNNVTVVGTIVEAIMKNTNEGKKQDFWYEGEKNLLAAEILRVCFSDDYAPEEKTMAQVYNDIASYDVAGFESLFKYLDPTHPAYGHFKIWQNGSPAVKESSLSGLGIRLNSLGKPLVQRIVSTDDIDLRQPGREKSIYYVVISDTTEQMKFISAMFFTELFIELVAEADSTEAQRLKIPVNFVLDEFRNIGGIPDFGKLLSTVRSREIAIMFILQDLNQLKQIYPDGESATILNDCQTKILLGTDDPDTTAKYFSALSGTQTVINKSAKYGEARTKLIKIHDEVDMSEGEGKREVMTIGEVLHMPLDKLMVSIKGEPGIVILDKLPYYSDVPGSNFKQKGRDGKMHTPHPMTKYMKTMKTTRHKPSWYDDFIQSETNKTEGQTKMEPAKTMAKEILGEERRGKRR